MEEIYLSADGLYEYSVVEINEAAARNKVTFEEYIASQGMKIKGSEVEETIEVEDKKPEPKDTPVEKAESNVPDWAFDAAGIIDPIQEPTKAESLLKEQPVAKELYQAESNTLTLQGNIAKDNLFRDEEDVAVDDFNEAYTSGQFDNWLQSPDQIKAAENQAKAEELVTQPSIQSALINSEYTAQDIRDFQSIGIEGLPDVSNIEEPKDSKFKTTFMEGSSQYKDIVEALNKSNIYNTFEKSNAELNDDKRFNYVSNIISSDNSEISEEEIPNKVNNWLLNNMITTSDDRAKSYLGLSLYNKYLKADSKGKNEILKEKFNSNNIEALVDSKGNFVDKSRVTPKQKEEIVTKQIEEVAEYSNMGTQSLLKIFKAAEDEVASLATTLVKIGEEDVNDAGFIFPRFVESGKKPLFGLAEDYVDPSFSSLEFMAKTGVVPKGLKYFPKGDNQLVNDYNKSLRKLQTIQLAVGLNVDLTKLDRESTGDILGEETDKMLGFESLGINEMQNTLLYEMQDELGFEAKKEEIAKLGLPGDIYVKQPKLNDKGNIVRNEQGNIEYDAINYERMLSTLPGFTKMSMEIAGTFLISGGAGNVAKVTTGIGDLIAINMARLKFSSKAATQFGKFSAGVLQESYGLVGSNTIGSNLFGSEKMPVIPFAVGSQLGHLGINWLGKVIPKGIARYATENQAFGNVVDFVNKMPGGSTVGGAIKFGSTPLISAGAIKGGEFTSGLLDVAKGEQSMDQLWHHITDVDSFIETYGALLFMSAAHPTQLMKKAVDNFQYDMLKLNTDMPSWNKLALDLGLETKKTGSWSRSEVNKAVDNLSNEIASNPELSPAEARQQLANVKAQGKRLGIKRQLDIEANKAENIENWNTTYKNLQRTINSINKGNKINVTDITNLVEAGIANGGASPILELKSIGLNSETATNLYKFSQTSYNEAQNYFKDVKSENFKSYVESGIAEMTAKNAKDNLNTMLKEGTISNAAYNTQLAEVESLIELETAKQENLIDLAKGDTEVRIKETRDYADQVIAEGSEIKELNNKEYVELKSSLGGKENNSAGFGFQTTIDGKPTFVINKDAMAPNKGEYRYSSGGKDYVIKGFQGSTLKHEIFHPVFENKFSAESVEKRARDLAGVEGDIDAARETIIRQDIEYIDQFKERLKELGVFNRVEQEMKLRPGYNELVTKGERSVEIEKEFINEFLELQNEGALNNLIKDIKFKEVSADVITDLKNGADIADYFFTGVEQTPEGKAKVKQAQEAYKELVKDGDGSIQLSEKKANDLAKEYKDGTIDTKGIENLIKQYNSIGLKALGYDIAKGDIPPENAISFINKEFVSILERYDGSTKLSTWINSNIRPKRQAFYEGEIGDKAKTTSIDSETARQVADTSTPETIIESKESAVKETERQISTFEGKEANRKKKEILEVAETIELQDMKPGVGGAPKKQVGEIGELIFEVPAEKISDPRKNLTFAKKLINLETGNIAKPGEKGVVSDSEFGNIQKFFSDKSNMKRFIKTLPETNVTSEQATVNKQGESIDVSREVVGRGIGLPNRIIKYFYEPTGKRSKGLTSQTAVYKLKPEFKNATPETIAKVQGDLLIGKDLKTYDRTVNGQLAKGMAMVEAMKIANEATRSKMPADTKLEKKVIADIKAGASKLSMSEKIKKGINADIEKLSGGALNKSNPKDFRKFEDNIIDKMTPILKEDIYSFITPSNIAAAGNEAFGSKPGSGAVGAGFFYITEFGTAKKPTAERTGETASMLEAGYIGEIRTLEKKIEEKYGYKKPRAKDRSYFAKTQGLKNYEYNLKNIKELNKQKSNLIDKLKEIVTKYPDASPTVKEFLYNQKANSSNTKNFALVTSRQKGATERNKYEEHPYQHGEFARDLTKAINSKVEGVYKNWKDYAGEEYYQTVFNRTTRIPSIRGDMRTYQGIVDLTYELPGYGTWKAQSQKYPLVNEMMDIAFKSGKKSDWAKVPPAADMRYFNEVIKLNPFELTTQQNGKEVTYAEKYGLEVSEFLESNPAIYKAASDLIFQINLTKAGKLTGDSKMTSKKAQETLDEIIKVKGTKEADLAFKETKTELDEPGVMNTSEKMTTEELVEKARTIDKALRMADRPNMPEKKIRIFDFDDTIAKTKSKVFAEREGERIELTAEEFAEKGMELIDQGYEMDFTDFNKVVEGKKGPLFDLIKKLKESPGERDLFILTARAPESQQAIFEFMKAMGVEIPLENITGLGKSSGEAKANWVIDKAAEGYNDFYFADDALQNVKAVKTALDVIDVKSKVQQARLNTSEKMNTTFNEIIEESTGIDKFKVFSDIKAQVRGASAKRQKFFIPPSAEDFLGLIYTTLGKGKKGEGHLKFYKDALLDPYTRAMENLSTDRVNLMADFKALKKELDVPKDLAKKTESGFTNEQATRVYLWNKMGEKIPGLSKTDLKELSDIIEKDPKLKVFADQILSITKGDGYSTPKEAWATGTITTDLIDILNTKKRSKYLETWSENKDVIYSKENLNKLEAAYGEKYRQAVESSLARMKSGSNRTSGGNKLSNNVLDYINNSTGAIMFFNTRSAILQTLSAANFINWGFNNPLRAGTAFANQPQYWKDFSKLMNSDYLVDRRNGLKLNINESEIANAAKTSKNKAKAALNYILEKGYLPTKYADSFAIASGGATFYRNRIKDLVRNEGKTNAEAEIIAMKEFRQVSEISQQSSDPSKISSQQASDLGRVVLQFANTPMQYARIQKRAVQDIVNGRGDLKTNISKIAYYAFAQNLLFNALQNGLFALGFGDTDIDEKEEKSIVRTVNGMLDSSLRGLGFAGVTVQVLKNLGIDIYDRSKRDRPEYGDAYKKLLDFSPAIKSKLGKFSSAGYPFETKKKRAEVFDKGFSLNNPAYESMAKVITGTTNLPLDRLYSKVNNLKAASDEETETWQSIAMVLGWPEWQIKGRQNYVEESKNPFTITKKKDNNPFAITKKKDKNPFATN